MSRGKLLHSGMGSSPQSFHASSAAFVRWANDAEARLASIDMNKNSKQQAMAKYKVSVIVVLGFAATC